MVRSSVKSGGLVAGLLLVPSAGSTQIPPPETGIAAAYDRSALFMPWNKGRMIVDDDVQPVWVADTHQVSFKLADGDGWRFVVADVDTAQRTEAFDHSRLAAALAAASGAPVDATRLPISKLAYPQCQSKTVKITAAGRDYSCNLQAMNCTPESPPLADRRYPAGGGRYAVFTRANDLWFVDLQNNVERRITRDGSANYAYGAVAGAGSPISRQRLGLPNAPAGSFSPDGSKFLSFRLDERTTPEVTLIQSVPPDGARPKSLTFRSAYPGDPRAVAELYLFDLAAGTATKLSHPPTTPFQRQPAALDQVHWSPDSRFVYFVDYANLFRERALFRADAANGKTDRMIVERFATSEFSYSTPDWRLLSDGSILWVSERTGWRHIYRYAHDGRLANIVTRGDWVVRDIIDVDEARGTLTFSAGGREAGDPYLRRVYRSGIDGHGLKLLTPEDSDHEVRVAGPQFQGVFPIDLQPAFSADRALFIDVHSRIDVPTKTVVRRRDGSIALTLATAHAATGAPAYRLPEPFRALASDGKTPLYGVIFKPTDFDPAKRYPVIDSMYGGPQAVFTPKTFGREIFGHYGRGLAELGTIVIVVDGRGTPQRSRAFQDAGYGQLGKAGFLEDHIAVIEQLARERPWMDVSNVGAFGYSAGGFAVVHALLDYPDFYNVGVAASTYDPELTNWTWAAQFQGVDDVNALHRQAAYRNAAQFKGKLFMLLGDLDDVADPAGTMRIADALIHSNKSFDLLVIPNGDHNVTVTPYALRRQWDYFTKHLLNKDPPANYRFLLPGEKP